MPQSPGRYIYRPGTERIRLAGQLLRLHLMIDKCIDAPVLTRSKGSFLHLVHLIVLALAILREG